MRRALALASALLVAGCALVPPAGPRVDSLRLTEVAEEGDPRRRASTRLVLEGLESDTDGAAHRAVGFYERAVQIDPSNPFAYLALARHHAAGEDWGRVLEEVAQSQALLRSQGAYEPRVAVHLDGLRGAALIGSEQPSEEAFALLEGAGRAAPDVWGDGVLSARELR